MKILFTLLTCSYCFVGDVMRWETLPVTNDSVYIHYGFVGLVVLVVGVYLVVKPRKTKDKK